MKLTISIKMDNAAFEATTGAEVARILRASTPSSVRETVENLRESYGDDPPRRQRQHGWPGEGDAMSSPLLVKAVQTLAGVCDGARSRDGSGFNKFDAQFGRQLALLDPALWTDGQARAAHAMLRKYASQLEGFGIQYAEIPKPEARPVESPRKLLSVDPDGFVLRYPFDERLNAEVRRIPGARWDKPRRGYLVPKRADAVRALMPFAAVQGFVWLEDSKSVAADVLVLAEHLVEASQAKEATLEVKGLGGTPRPFQLAAVKYALHTKRVMLGDEMGLGKTIEALITIQAAEAFPALVVCPA